MSRLALALAIALVVSAAPATVGAAAEYGSGADPIMLVVDTSGSMGDDDGTGKIKIDGAKLALLDFLDNVAPETPIGLRSYPSSGSGSCNPGDDGFPVDARDTSQMSAYIRALEPGGDTPTAEALEQAFDELNDTYDRGTIVLVSDGESTCAPPCDTAAEIAKSGFDIETITVGFNISDSGRKELECIADALNGRYVDANDNDALNKVLDDLSRPKLRITNMHYPSKVIAEAGSEPDGSVKVTATIANEGRREARDVLMRLRFDLNGPGAARPVLRLGNLAGGQSRNVSWTFRPGASATDSLIKFTVFGSALNSPSDTQVSGSMRVIDLTTAADAGPILAGKKRIAIMGDSFSSGEGAESYVGDSDRDGNACHRSSATHMVSAFGIPEKNVIACSGAIAEDIYSNDRQRYGQDAQIEQLKTLYSGGPGQVDAVVMTLGGNDFRFPGLAASCIVGLRSCHDRVYVNAPLPFPWYSFKDFRNLGMDSTSPEQRSIVSAYEAINATLNSSAAMRTRGGKAAPIIVLGYPLPIPLTGRSCLPMVDYVSAPEIKAVGQFALQLNGLIEGLAKKLQNDGIPVFYVPNTENSLLPDHTICDPLEREYARSIASADREFLLMALRLAEAPTNPLGTAGYMMSADYRRGMRSKSELVHPNARGHVAMTNALLRWTRGAEGRSAARYLETVKPVDPLRLPVVEGLELDPASGNPVLQGGSTYPLQADGYMPGSDVLLMVRSRAMTVGRTVVGKSGAVATRVSIPLALEAGDHKIEVAGVDPAGRPRVQAVAFRIEDEVRVSLGLGIGISGFVLALVALAMLLSSGSARSLAMSGLTRSRSPENSQNSTV